jgi:hypothetical protein
VLGAPHASEALRVLAVHYAGLVNPAWGPGALVRAYLAESPLLGCLEKISYNFHLLSVWRKPMGIAS